MKSKTPPLDTISASQFRNLQSRADIQNKDLASTDSNHMESATAARIRHLVSDLYPQWREVKTDGHIFTG